MPSNISGACESVHVKGSVQVGYEARNKVERRTTAWKSFFVMVITRTSLGFKASDPEAMAKPTLVLESIG